MRTASETTTIENYCIECKQVAREDCEARGHIVGTLGQTGKRDRDHCAYVHEKVGIRCGGYRKGHEERYVDHPFTERQPDTPAAAREEWELGPLSISSGVRCYDVLRKGVNRFAGGFICSAAEQDANQIVADHARAALVPRLVEALEGIRDYFYLLPSDVQDAARETLAVAKGEPR